MQRCSISLLILGWFSFVATQLTCPIPWWYCLNRDPQDNSQVMAVDTSNRSIKWSWDSGGGRWDVSYYHSFPTGRFSVFASFNAFGEQTPAYVTYNSDSSWSSNKKPILTTAWDMSYSGDVFGFEPRSNGQYTFHIYSRKLRYDPFTNAPTSFPTPAPVKPRCPIVAQQRAKGTFWWLERKSNSKCTVTVNRANLVSPVEWEWQTDLGRWRVSYSWSSGSTNCSVYYTKDENWSQNTQIVAWSFRPEQLIITYSSKAVKMRGEEEWRLQVIGGEAWSIVPANNDQWNFLILSRNVVIRPFQKPRGTFNLF